MKTRVKAGWGGSNHSETLVNDGDTPRGLKVRTNVRAGWGGNNHNETLVRKA